MSIFVLLDRVENNNDKKWLIENLKAQCSQPVIPIYSKFILSVEYRNGLMGKLRVLKEIIFQSIRLLRQSKKDDIVICWTVLSMHILYPIARLFRYHRHFIAMNWISPQATSRFNWMKRMMVRDKKVKIVVNTPELIQTWQEILQPGRPDVFYCIPDVYDTRIPFREITPREKKYFFTGGMSNRDWGLLCHLALNYPDINFVCCALEDDFSKKVKNIPPNMIVHFNIETNKYYELLSGAYAVLLPLCTTVVSGLINIIRSAQEGVLCLITETPATRQYYDEKTNDLLLSFNETDWDNKIKELLEMPQEEMMKHCMQFSSYIKKKFSPASAVEYLISLFPSNKT